MLQKESPDMLAIDDGTQAVLQMRLYVAGFPDDTVPIPRRELMGWCEKIEAVTQIAQALANEAGGFAHLEMESNELKRQAAKIEVERDAVVELHCETIHRLIKHAGNAQ